MCYVIGWSGGGKFNLLIIYSKHLKADFVL